MKNVRKKDKIANRKKERRGRKRLRKNIKEVTESKKTEDKG